MRFPGFTADASLERTLVHYKLEESYAGTSNNLTIVPQRIKLRDVHCACDSATDVCVCDNGRVIDLLLGDIR